MKRPESGFNELEEELREKRRAKLMLDVLEKRESIRLRRFQDLKKQLDELRYVGFSNVQRNSRNVIQLGKQSQNLTLRYITVLSC